MSTRSAGEFQIALKPKGGALKARTLSRLLAATASLVEQHGKDNNERVTIMVESVVRHGDEWIVAMTSTATPRKRIVKEKQ